MPSKLTKKYRKNNITTKKTKNKRGGKQPKIVSSFLESTMNTISNQNKQLEVSRNSKNPWVDRETNKIAFEKKWNMTEDKLPCPPDKFGEFTIKKWANFGGCGFNIWDKYGNKFWIDINPYYNIAKAVKDETGWQRGVTHIAKTAIIEGLDPEYRSPDKTPDFFFKLFPEGYKVTEDGETITLLQEPESSKEESTNEALQKYKNAEKEAEKVFGKAPPAPTISGGSKKTTKRRKKK
jgi:hypothetical protein